MTGFASMSQAAPPRQKRVKTHRGSTFRKNFWLERRRCAPFFSLRPRERATPYNMGRGKGPEDDDDDVDDLDAGAFEDNADDDDEDYQQVSMDTEDDEEDQGEEVRGRPSVLPFFSLRAFANPFALPPGSQGTGAPPIIGARSAPRGGIATGISSRRWGWIRRRAAPRGSHRPRFGGKTRVSLLLSGWWPSPFVCLLSR